MCIGAEVYCLVAAFYSSKLSVPKSEYTAALCQGYQSPSDVHWVHGNRFSFELQEYRILRDDKMLYCILRLTFLMTVMLIRMRNLRPVLKVVIWI